MTSSHTYHGSALAILYQSKRWWSLGTLVGLVVAVVFVTLTPVKHEAHLLFRVGQIGQFYGQELPKQEAPLLLIEPIANTLQRLKSAGFQNDLVNVISKEYPSDNVSTLQQHLSKSTAHAVKNTDLIEVTLIAPTAAKALAWGNIYSTLLISRHQQLGKPMLMMQQAQLALAEKNLLRLNDPSLVNSSPFTNLAQLTQSDKIAFWEQRLLSLQQLLAAPNTRPTALVEPITSNALAPKKMVIFLGFSLLGFVLGLLTFIGRQKYTTLTIKNSNRS